MGLLGQALIGRPRGWAILTQEKIFEAVLMTDAAQQRAVRDVLQPHGESPSVHQMRLSLRERFCASLRDLGLKSGFGLFFVIGRNRVDKGSHVRNRTGLSLMRSDGSP